MFRHAVNNKQRRPCRGSGDPAPEEEAGSIVAGQPGALHKFVGHSISASYFVIAYLAMNWRFFKEAPATQQGFPELFIIV
jgi:hypothetical protein